MPAPPLKPAPPIKRDSKSKPVAPIAQSATDDGYLSEGDEPSQSFYEGMIRTADRQRIADPRQRQQDRATARNGWPAFAAEPKSYVRDEDHFYRQLLPHCAATCSAFFYLRHIGYSVKQTIRILNSLKKSGHIARWQQGYLDAWASATKLGHKPEVGTATAQRYSNIAADILEIAHKFPEKLSTERSAMLSRRRDMPLPMPDIFYPQIIGVFPPRDWSDKAETALAFGVNFKKGPTAVTNKPRPPSSKSYPTFQQSLLTDFQACVKTVLPHPDGPKRMQTRSPAPWVELYIYAPDDDGSPNSHFMMLDFSDPQQPGIFDPNFGWMEPQQGFCFLSLEQALNSIWEFYTHNVSTVPMTKGLRFLDTRDNKNLFFQASQIYVQSPIPSAADLKLKPLRR